MIDAVDFGRREIALLAGAEDRAVSYAELGRWVAADRERLRRLEAPVVAFQFAPNCAAGVAFYLACLAERVPLGLGEPGGPARDRLIGAYRPSAIALPEAVPPPAGYTAAGELAGGGLLLWQRPGAYPVAPGPGLALLLTTSGSTGDPKLVRLSHANLEANARAIASYLAIGPGEVALQSLPLHYSYGLSILNSHLVAGAAVALTPHSFMRPEFWAHAERCGGTSFAGVPFMYETLRRLRIEPMRAAKLRTLTQAGGHLRPEIVAEFHASAVRRGGRFFVMYGQTEATARMAYVPPDRLAEKPGSIGIAIPGGSLWTEPVEGAGAGQLHYRGANVMLGYAQGPADVARGDELGGVLATGDLAVQDADGYFRLAGRLARFAKLFGKRVNLLDVETEIEKRFAVRAAAVESGEALKIFCEGGGERDGDAVRAHLVDWLGLPAAAVKVVATDRIPLTSSGKKNYGVLA